MFLFVALVVTRGSCVPHSRSPTALVGRRARALERGFFVPRLAGSSRVLMQSSLAPRLRVAAKSLSLCATHAQLVGEVFHFAAHAALAVVPLLGAEHTKAALVVHRHRNRVVDDGLATSSCDEGRQLHSDQFPASRPSGLRVVLVALPGLMLTPMPWARQWSVPWRSPLLSRTTPSLARSCLAFLGRLSRSSSRRRLPRSLAP